ncbi:Spx/MgsR family RNA polymerase-binding regulatory protein [Maritalea sp.]|uniref:Spx/MgsR family RNA polymerase-binding regulatory protein n=1 Tax=Maritalea sp. TaxID=2003361 RepID=UPI003EFA832F
MKLYGLKNCDTCRKAKKMLEAKGHEVTFVDVRQSPLEEKQLSQFLKAFGEDKLINKKSTTWRQLSEADRTKPALELLVENPSLMKRPVIELKDTLHLGWTKDVQEALSM